MKPEHYSQGDAFQAEKRTLFSTAWLPVCADAQIAAPGDFLSVTVGGWGVVAVRDGSSAVRVLRNACRHQNMPVVGTPSGHCESFRCRFHGWTYDLAGKFLSAPPAMAPADPAADHDLASLAVAIEGGIVFFNLGTSTALAAPAEPPRLGAPLPPYGGTVTTEIAANWKVVAEHLLGSRPPHAEGFAWQDPLLGLRRAGTKAIVEQIVPHTFLRTRLFTHLFGETADDHHRNAASVIKDTCERLQGDRTAGTMAADDSPLLSSFHQRIEEAYAGSS